MSELPSWTQVVIAMGSTGLLSGLLAWATGHQMASANARKVNAEAAKLEADTRMEAVRVEANRVDFEKTLNERVTLVMGNLQSQVKYLSELVEAQSSKINNQSALIAKMELEIKELHKALDAKTQHLQQVLALLPSTRDLYQGTGTLDLNVLGNSA